MSGTANAGTVSMSLSRLFVFSSRTSSVEVPSTENAEAAAVFSESDEGRFPHVQLLLFEKRDFVLGIASRGKVDQYLLLGCGGCSCSLGWAGLAEGYGCG